VEGEQRASGAASLPSGERSWFVRPARACIIHRRPASPKNQKTKKKKCLFSVLKSGTRHFFRPWRLGREAVGCMSFYQLSTNNKASGWPKKPPARPNTTAPGKKRQLPPSPRPYPSYFRLLPQPTGAQPSLAKKTNKEISSTF
jgi:hypothetical protein